MGFESEFDDMFNEAVTLTPTASEDEYGSRTPGTPRTVSARIESDPRMVRDGQGREVASNTVVFLKPTATDASAIAPTPNDQIVLPAGYSPASPPIISVSRANDESGLHHWVVRL